MVHPDMMCFVQAFASKKKDKNADDNDDNDDDDDGDYIYTLRNNEQSSIKQAKKTFSRKLSFSFRKKSPSCPSSGTVSPLGDKFQSSPVHSTKSYDYEEMSHNQEVSIQQHAAAAAAAEEILTNTRGSSKARQKKFHRHFREVPPEEKVINYYSCALIGDVLLHGNLYITKNYFAFYSNHFGSINKILISTSSILKITKEKTALSKPNAVAIISVKEKHLFGLFLSRDTTYKLMIQVWNAAMKPFPSQLLSPSIKENFKDSNASCSSRDQNSGNDDESSLSGSDINILGSPDLLQVSYSNDLQKASCSKSSDNTDSTINSKITPGSNTLSLRANRQCQTLIPTWSQYIYGESKANFILGTSTILLAVLFLSAGILLYRISCLQQSYSQNNYLTTTRSMNEIQEFLSINLHYITKVRKSLEALSVLIEQEALSNIVQPNIDSSANNIPS